jgi:hypothetical protein
LLGGEFAALDVGQASHEISRALATLRVPRAELLLPLLLLLLILLLLLLLLVMLLLLLL